MFIVYENDGSIRYTAEVSDAEAYRRTLAAHGASFIEVRNGDLPGQAASSGNLIEQCYVAGGALRERPVSTAVLDRSVAKAGEPVTLSHLALGACVTVTGPVGQAFSAEAEKIALTFVLPGRYEIAVEAFPQQAARFSLEVGE